MTRFAWLPAALVLAGVSTAACGGSPAAPRPPELPPPPVNLEPPANTAPVIESMTAQGRRQRQPARFADLRETVDVTVTVRDAETPLEQLTFEWTAPVGTFDGSGRTVAWTAPDSSSAVGPVTLTVKVTENYGHPGQPKIYKHEVTSAVVVRVHDSAREIGDMALRFLTEFSKPQSNQDWQDIMRDFKASACPRPSEVESERADVINHYTNFVMHNYSLGAPSVRIDFGSACAFRGKPGDACVSVPVFWDSTDKRNNDREQTSGIDHMAAVYSSGDSRWWLCSSDYEAIGTSGHSFYWR